LEPPDPSVRNVEIIAPSTPQHDLSRKSSATGGMTSGGKKKGGTDENFYSDEDEEETSTEGPDTEDEEEEEEEEEGDEKEQQSEKKTNEYEQLDARSTNNVEQESEEEEEEEESSSSSEEEESEEEESESEESADEEKVNFLFDIKHSKTVFHFQPISKQPPRSTVAKPVSTIPVSDYTIPATEKSLLEMDCKSISPPKIYISIFYLVEAFLGSTSTNVPAAPPPPKNNMFDDLHGLESLTSTSSTLTYTRQYDCLNRITGQGLQIQYRFPRTSYRRSPNMVHVELIFTNTTANKDIQSIKFLKPVCFSYFSFFFLYFSII